MKYILATLLAVHGSIHLIGVGKAFRLGRNLPLTSEISPAWGALWLLTFIFLLAAAWLLILDKRQWWMLAVPALFLSQILVFSEWKDASFGTTANILILVACVWAYGTWHFNRLFQQDVTQLLQANKDNTDLLHEEDIQEVPELVQKYIRITGCLGKPKVNNFRVDFTGRIRQSDNAPWMPFQSQQFNALDPSTRLFFMHATMKHLPVVGYHHFKNGRAVMDIRLLSLIRVQYQEGEQMDVAETVTYFNDMCVMAPATLIDKRIKWKDVTAQQVTAEFTMNGITISALLDFDEEGKLINFTSPDRYAFLEDGAMHKLTWSTPVANYKDFGGYQLASSAQAVYQYPTGQFVYGEFHTESITYNNETVGDWGKEKQSPNRSISKLDVNEE